MDQLASDNDNRYFDLPLERIDAVVMDLDGVITDTASLHEAAWKQLFNAELSNRGMDRRFTREDYLRYVDGKSRRDGVESFLSVVGIELPEGTPDDADYTESIWGIAKRKDEYFLSELEKTGPRPYPGTVDLLKKLRARGKPIAVVSASRNCRMILQTAGLSALFDVRIDGEEFLRMGLPGKPDPAGFLEAARRLGYSPQRTMVAEDAIAGVHAGKAGGFGLVVGVDRTGQSDVLLDAGADIVVSDLAYLRISSEDTVLQKAGSQTSTPTDTLVAASLRNLLNSSWIFTPARSIRDEQGSEESSIRKKASWFSLANGFVGTRGGIEEDANSANTHVFVSRLYYKDDNGMERLMELPSWMKLALTTQLPEGIRFLDLEAGVLVRVVLQDSRIRLCTLRLALLTNPSIQLLVAFGDDLAGTTNFDEDDEQIEQAVTRSNLGGGVVSAVGGFHIPIAELFGVANAKDSAHSIDGATSFYDPKGRDHTDTAIWDFGLFSHGLTAKTAYVRVAIYEYSNKRSPSQTKAVDKFKAVRYRAIRSLLDEQRTAWQQRWRHADIEITGDPDMTRFLRFALFHLISSVPSTGEAAVGARGLSGPAYSGHVFWDSDVFVLPMLAATHPGSARAILEYRLRRLNTARAAANASGRSGLRFPWESAHDGKDVTPHSGLDEHGKTVPIRTGDMEEHITADVAWAAWQMASWTGRWQFLYGAGMPLVVETAQYWAERVEQDSSRKFHLNKVIGPDEYHEEVDDNVYTNIMAAWNLRRGAELLNRVNQVRADTAQPDAHHPMRSGLLIHRNLNRLQMQYMSDQNIQASQSWLEIADSIVDGYNDSTGRYEQFAGFDNLEPLTVADIGEPPLAADLLLGRERLAKSQIIKQADVLMAYLLVPDMMKPDTLATNLDFYLKRTAHGSSLSPAVHAGLLAQSGRLNEALNMLELACAIDVDDLTGTVGGGIHLANFGAIWQAVVTGFAGIRVSRPDDTALRMDPHIPDSWGELKLHLIWHNKPLELLCRPDAVEIVCDAPLRVQLGDSPPVRVKPPGGKLR